MKEINTAIATEIIDPDTNEKFKVEFEVVPTGAESFDDRIDPEFASEIANIDSLLTENQGKLDAINSEIDRLTSHADGIDLAVSAGCGVVCGLIDSFFVGEFDFANAKAWSNKTINEKVSKFAKDHGYSGDSKRLKNHVKFLEDKYKIPSDNLWSGKNAGISAKSHHLDDFAHHPTPVGWICSIITQFTKHGYFSNRNGEGFSWSVEDKELIGDSIPEKFAAGTINWIGHLVSDMAGSNSTAGSGMGLPGPIVSIVKEISSLPLIKDTNLPQTIHKVFVKEKFDLRSELAIAHELGRQAIPVVINEVLVRLFYFLRRLISEWREFGFSKIHWKNTLPFKNRTIARMLTVATGTFTAVDLADAGIRAAVQTAGQPAAFMASFLLKVNFVGVGRFAMAVVTDVGMGIKKSSKEGERIVVMNERLHLHGAKLCYRQANTWRLVGDTADSVNEMCIACCEAYVILGKNLLAMKEDVDKIGELASSIEKKHPGFKAMVRDIIDL